jgi:hypothetical protein
MTPARLCRNDQRRLENLQLNGFSVSRRIYRILTGVEMCIANLPEAPGSQPALFPQNPQ